MRYIVQFDRVRVIYKDLESMTEQVQKLFRFLIHLGEFELQQDGYVYTIER